MFNSNQLIFFKLRLQELSFINDEAFEAWTQKDKLQKEVKKT
jgi:hypothetical protein